MWPPLVIKKINNNKSYILHSTCIRPQKWTIMPVWSTYLPQSTSVLQDANKYVLYEPNESHDVVVAMLLLHLNWIWYFTFKHFKNVSSDLNCDIMFLMNPRIVVSGIYSQYRLSAPAFRLNLLSPLCTLRVQRIMDAPHHNISSAQPRIGDYHNPGKLDALCENFLQFNIPTAFCVVIDVY